MPSTLRLTSKILSTITPATVTGDSAPVVTTFNMLIETTTENESFTIACQNHGTFNATIDWGDGSTSTVTSYNDADLGHTYVSAGDHLISISGVFPNIYMYNATAANKLKVKQVQNLGNMGWLRLTYAFYGCANMTTFVAGTCDTSGNLYTDLMFYGCTNLVSVNVSGFDTSNVTNMRAMFMRMENILFLDVSSLDTSSCTDMDMMFRQCKALQTLNVSGFDTSNVTDMQFMFEQNHAMTSCDVSGFDTSNVTNMQFMFSRCYAIPSIDVTNFNTSNVTNMHAMFHNTNFLTSLDVSSFDTSNVTNMSHMFSEAHSLTSLDLSTFDTSNVTNMSSTLKNCKVMTNVDLSNWNTSSCTNMNWFFGKCNLLQTVDVSHFDTSSVADMQFMFSYLYNLQSIDVTNFNTSNVTNMYAMFHEMRLITSIDVTNFDTSNVTNLGHMFSSQKVVTSLDVTNFDTSSCTEMVNMFSGCSDLTSLDVSSFDTSNVTNMAGMFEKCYDLTTLNISSFDTSSCTTMNSMFRELTNMPILDLSHFDTSLVTDMWAMFYRTRNVTDIIGIENFNIEALNQTDHLQYFFEQGTLPTARYNALLINWDAQDPLDNMYSIDFGNSTYTAGGTAAAARANLISTDGWSIIDGGTAPPAPFDMTVRTTAANETFAIPCQNVGTFNATVDWGDGSTSAITAYNDSDLTHTYASAGDHSISISGTFPNIYFAYAGDKAKVISVTNLGQVGWQTFENAFAGCNNMTSFTSGVTDISSVTNMSFILSDCYKIASLDLSTLDTSSVTNMSGMFRSAGSQAPSGFSLDLSNFDTSNVTSMDSMFKSATKITSLDISSFDTSSVTNMSYMFERCPRFTGTLDLRYFNTSNVTNMYGMFNQNYSPNSSFITSINVTGWDTSNVTSFGLMFAYMENLTSITGLNTFDTSSATAMNGMFLELTSLTSLDVSNFDTSNVLYMNAMFMNLTNLTDINGIENFNIESLNGTSTLNAHLAGTSITTARYDALLVNWDAQDPLDNMTADFGNNQYTAGGTAAAARANLISNDNWTIQDGGTAPPAPFDMTVRTTAANETFTIRCKSVGSFNATVDWGDGSSSTVTTYNSANLVHTYASAGDHAISVSGTFPNIDFNNSSSAAKVIAVTNFGEVGWNGSLSRAFWGCTNMTSFTSGVTDTSGITSLQYFWRNCENLTSIDVSTFDTSNVTQMDQMFFNCFSIPSIDVSSWDVSSVRYMRRTFAECHLLETINVTNWATTSVFSFNLFASNAGRDVTGTFDIIGVENFNIEALNQYFSSLRDFMIAPIKLPTARYDAWLINLDAQTSPNLTLVGFGSSQYTAGGTAAAARANLISNDGWTITDGGTA
jgi:surface protein